VLTRDPLPALRTLRAAADAGEPRVLEALAEAGHVLGIALDDIVGVLNPDVVVLGGYLGLLAPYLLGPVQEHLAGRLAAEPFRSTRVLVLEELAPRVLAGAMIAARDVCLTNPLGLTEVVLSA
jgi:predicted NBD/HSP70 family sugar kinase